ncbi:MAG: aldo/keto reductase [Erysipelotrichaceae bacterium]|nr:aldo/keto reductase [Erysipelotrichaceae bacterium]
MKTRTNIKNQESLSILGFGAMRLPKIGKLIDEEASEKMIISAIERGVNYFDTAYVYQNGKSEIVLGKILAKGYRDRVNIATKMPPFMIRKTADFDKIFNIQLQRLQTDRIDYYLIHMLMDVSTWDRLKGLGILEWISEKKKSGQIRNLGFSFHGTQQEFLKIIDAYDWDFTQIQYNFIDEFNQAGKTGLLYAASKGIPVIIMEPLRGGKIVFGLPKEVDKIWKEMTPERSVVEWALRWVWNHPQVLLLLSGMSTQEQVDDNIRIADIAAANTLSIQELALFDKAREIIREKTKVPCTACGYCMPCPHGVDIPAVFAAYNDKYLNNKGFSAMFTYMQNTGAMTKHPAYASLCQSCHACEPHCPQSIQISDRMKDVKDDLEGPFFKPIAYLGSKFMG